MMNRIEAFEPGSKSDVIIDTWKELKKFDLASELRRGGFGAFDDEAREGLKREGFERIILLGNPQRLSGVLYPSTRTEAATLRSIVLPYSGNKTASQQLEMVAQFSEDLARRIPGVHARLGTIGENAELASNYLQLHQEDAFAGYLLRTGEPITGGRPWKRTDIEHDEVQTTVRIPRKFLFINRSPRIVRGVTRVPREVIREGVTPLRGSGFTTEVVFQRVNLKPEDHERHGYVPMRNRNRFSVSRYEFKHIEIDPMVTKPVIVVAPIVFPANPASRELNSSNR